MEISDCNSKGPSVMYVSHFVTCNDYTRIACFGRVFAGSISEGQKVRALASSHMSDKDDGCSIVAVQGVCTILGRNLVTIDRGSSGSLVCVEISTKNMAGPFTIVGADKACRIADIPYRQSTVIRATVTAKNAGDVESLNRGAKMLSILDPLCILTQNAASGSINLEGISKIHLTSIINDLKRKFCKVPLKVSNYEAVC